MRKFRNLTWFVVAGVVLYSGYILLSRRMADQRWEDAQRKEAPKNVPGVPPPSAGVKILQFYTSTPAVARNERALLCYGVANAKAARIEPAVEEIKPSLSRCIEAHPQRSTTYTLHATGHDGNTVSSSIEVTVGARSAAASQMTAVQAARILYFREGETRRENGKLLVSLCFATENAAEVQIDPGVMPASSVPMGCFWVSPERTTTYTLSARGRNLDLARRSLTVEVKPS